LLLKGKKLEAWKKKQRMKNKPARKGDVKKIKTRQVDEEARRESENGSNGDK